MTLSGQLERRSDAELLPPQVASVRGVVSVRPEVTWAWDDRKALQEATARAGSPAPLTGVSVESPTRSPPPGP